jgi:hypothetical protein
VVLKLTVLTLINFKTLGNKRIYIGTKILKFGTCVDTFCISRTKNKTNCLNAQEKKNKQNNNPAYFRECFIEKTRKKKKQPFSRCQTSKLHLEKFVPNSLECFAFEYSFCKFLTVFEKKRKFNVKLT